MAASKRIPLVDLEAQHRPIRDELLAAMTRCVDSQNYILGEAVASFEKAFAGYCGVEHAVGVSSGTDALLLSLMALGVGPGDEVVTTAYSFFGTAGVVARLGAVPVFVDIEEDTFNLDTSRLEERLSGRTKVVMPVHLYGQCADMETIEAVASERGIPILEDAAQAIGAKDARGKSAGAMGVAGCFSFYPSKNLAAMGDAGMVVCGDASLAESFRKLRNHGEEATYIHEVVGGNFRLDALQAAVLNVKLQYLERWIEARRLRAHRYRELFERLVDAGRIVLPAESGGRHVYHQYVIRVDAERRDTLREDLARDGVATGVYYPLPLPLQPCFKDLGHGPGDFPVAERASKEGLALPVHADLTEDDQRYVVTAIERSLSS